MNNKPLLFQVPLYVATGIATFGTEYVIFLITYYLAGLPVAYANFISFAAALSVSFLLNKKIVFKVVQPRNKLLKQLLQYFSLAAVNLLITTVGIYYVVEAGLPAFLAKLIFIGIVASWNFIMYKRVIFSKKTSANE